MKLKRLTSDELVMYGVTVAFWAIVYLISAARGTDVSTRSVAANKAAKDLDEFLASQEGKS